MRKPIETDERKNRRGCFVLIVALVLAIAALSYVGLGADAVNEVSSKIPTWGSYQRSQMRPGHSNEQAA